MQREFSFRDFFFYTLNRWFYVLLSVAVCAVAAIGWSFYQNSQSEGRTKIAGSATICEIEAYEMVFGSLQGQVVVAGYQENSRRVMDVLSSVQNHQNFLQDDANLALVVKLVADEQASDFFEHRVQVVSQEYVLGVGIEFYDRDGWANEDVEAVIDAYLSYVIDLAYSKVESFEKLNLAHQAGLIGAPIRQGLASLVALEPVEEVSGIARAAIGVVVGMMLGVLVVLTLYLIDPKIKSINEVARAGFVPVHTGYQPKLEEKTLSAVAVYADKAQAICVIVPQSTGCVGEVAKKLGAYLGQVGNRVLMVDGTKTGGALGGFLNGETLTKTTEDGVDVVSFTKSDDFARILVKKERFCTLFESYDKVVILCASEHMGAVRACTSVASVAICVCDTGTHTKDLYAVANDVSDAVEARFGIVMLKSEQ